MQPTSIAANRNITANGGKIRHKQRILDALTRCNEGTFDRIASFTNLTESQVWKRMSELKTDELVCDSGRKGKLKSGDSGIIWQLTEKSIQRTKQN